MQYIISIMLFVSTIVKKRSYILVFAVTGFLWILYAFNTNNADYENYKLHYMGYYKSELGFGMLCKIGNFLNLPYQVFIGVISLICLLIIIKIIKRYTDNIAFVLGLYFIFPFLLDVVQVRNFIEMTILIYSIKFLTIDKRGNNFKYLLCVLVATSIHTSAVFYVILLLAKYMNKKKLFIMILLVVPTGCILAYSNIINYIFTFLELSLFKEWFQTKPKLGFLLMFAIQALSFFILYIAYYKLNKKGSIKLENKFLNVDLNQRGVILNKNSTTVITSKTYDMILKINIILFFIFILYMYNAIYFRLYRNILILNYCVIIQAITNSFKFDLNKRIYTLFVILWVAFLFFYMIIYSSISNVFIPIFNENIIFKIFNSIILFYI